MSYILDALQRSQRERELGQVPTVGTVQHETTGRASSRPNSWILVTLLLALAALAVGLYAALQAHSDRQAAVAVETAAKPPGPTPAAASAPPPVTPAEQPAVNPAPARLVTKQPTVKPTYHPGAEPEVSIEYATPSPISTSRPKASALDEAPRPSAKPNEPPAEPAMVDNAPLQTDPFPPESKPAPPRDLREEVAAFKQQLQLESSIPNPPAAKPELPQYRPDPQVADNARPAEFSALPLHEQGRIPAHRLSVHVYTKDPGKRFVILNSRRMGEGETNQDGLKVESIEHKGVVLSYQGVRFFRRR